MNISKLLCKIHTYNSEFHCIVYGYFQLLIKNWRTLPQCFKCLPRFCINYYKHVLMAHKLFSSFVQKINLNRILKSVPCQMCKQIQYSVGGKLNSVGLQYKLTVDITFNISTFKTIEWLKSRVRKLLETSQSSALHMMDDYLLRVSFLERAYLCRKVHWETLKDWAHHKLSQTCSTQVKAHLREVDSQGNCSSHIAAD